MPDDVAAWLERRAAARQASPPPHLPETPAQQRGRTEEAKQEARELGRRLAAALKALGWTQPSLAQAVGRSVQTANYWITGKIPPPLVVVEWAERLAADDAADPSPRAKVGSVPLTEVMKGIDLLRKAGLTKVAKLLEQQMDGAATEVEETVATPAHAPAKISGAAEKKVPPAPMTQDEAWACLGVLGWKARDPARLIGFDTRNGRRWFSGDDTMPPAMAAWLRKLVAVHRAATQGLPKNTPEEGRVAVGAKAVAAAMGDLARLAEEVRAWEHVQVERKLAARAASPAVSEDASGLAGLLGEDHPAVRGGR